MSFTLMALSRHSRIFCLSSADRPCNCSGWYNMLLLIWFISLSGFSRTTLSRISWIEWLSNSFGSNECIFDEDASDMSDSCCSAGDSARAWLWAWAISSSSAASWTSPMWRIFSIDFLKASFFRFGLKKRSNFKVGLVKNSQKLFKSWNIKRIYSILIDENKQTFKFLALKNCRFLGNMIYYLLIILRLGKF